MPRPSRRGPDRREREAPQIATMTHGELIQVAYFGGLLKDHEYVFHATHEQRMEAHGILKERRGRARSAGSEAP
jgi:hypothetical protein